MKTNLHIKLIITGLIICCLIPLSTPAQIFWDKYEGNPVISAAPWVSRAAIPVVIYEDQVFKMWFTAANKIGYGTSPDGITWTLNDDPVIPQAAPGSWDYYRGTGSVIRVNDTLKMWYFGSNDPSGWEWAIGYAWSSDNITWNLFPTPVLEKGDPGSWDEVTAAKPSVYYDGQLYHMWYFGQEGSSVYDPTCIGYATSTNGINWIKYPQ